MNVNSESAASADRVIELGVIRLPVSVGPNPAESFRPRICLFVDQNSGMVVHHELTPPLDDYVPLILKSLPLVNKQLRGTPLQIQVRDVGLAAALKPRLETKGIDVVVRESLPMLDEAAASLLQRYAGEENEAARGVLDEAGMTLEHLAGFADAAKAFYQARPWRHLIDDDLIEIQSPDGPAGTRFAQILARRGNYLAWVLSARGRNTKRLNPKDTSRQVTNGRFFRRDRPHPCSGRRSVGNSSIARGRP